MKWLKRLNFRLMYLGSPPWDTQVSPPELKNFIKKHPAGRAIDLGCGTGTNVITLAQNGWQVTGVDFVPRAIRQARRKLRQADVVADLHVGDVTRLEGIEGPFDLALDMGCFHTLGDQKAAYLATLDRVLASGGFWLLYTFLADTSASPTGPGTAPADLDLIHNRFHLISRQDGSERGMRPSAWFIYQKPTA